MLITGAVYAISLIGLGGLRGERLEAVSVSFPAPARATMQQQQGSQPRRPAAAAQKRSPMAFVGPAAAALAACGCLVLGTRVGWKRAMVLGTKPSKSTTAATVAEAVPSPGKTVVDAATGETASQMAAKALIYGTLLAFGSMGGAVGGLAWMWDAHSVRQRRFQYNYCSAATPFASQHCSRKSSWITSL